MGRRKRKDYRQHLLRKKRVRIVLCVLAAAGILGAGTAGVCHAWRLSREESAQEDILPVSGVAENGIAADSGGKESGVQDNCGTDTGMMDNGSVVQGGYRELVSSSEPVTAAAAERKRPGVKVKGIYVTGPMAGNEAFDQLLELVDKTELNTMVIDVKNDSGEITWQMEQDTVRQIGASVRYIRDMEGFMSRLKEHDVYTIARIVCFKDPYLAEYAPELALKKPDGKAVMDGNGLAWVNPYQQAVWEYLVEVAKAAADIGFDEIQFDYVRFPIGKDADAADYGVDMETYPKQKAITGFLTYAVQELHERGVLVTADVFGTIIGSETDVRQVGQDYVELSSVIDVLSPMVYPSHYGNHVFGLDVPDAWPYETVLAALTDSGEELQSVPEDNRAVVRPWLQAFTASWVEGYISYGGEQIRRQIQAVYDAGYEEWILWNAANRYTEDGLLKE